MTRTILKRCPCCRSNAHLVIDWDSKRINGCFGQYVACTNCPARSLTQENATLAISCWNNDILKQDIQLTLF